MCAIAGIIDLKYKRSFNPQIITLMSRFLSQRGGDDQGSYMAPGILLIHHRLAITDVKGGKQPFVNKEIQNKQDNKVRQNKKNITILNGQIFNYKSLQRQVKDKLRTKSDIEVLAKIFSSCDELFNNHKHIRKTLQQLDGAFAFAFFEQSKGALLLARDPFGEKPLFYMFKDDCLFFASDIRALSIFNDAVIDKKASLDFAYLGFITGSRTIYKNIKCLKPGHYIDTEQLKKNYLDKDIDFCTDDITQQLYIDIFKQSQPQNNDDFNDVFKNSIKEKINCKRPASILFSGGKDSSLIACVFKKLKQNQPLLHCKLTDEEYIYAKNIAHYLANDLQIFDFTKTDSLFDNFQEIYQNVGQPFSDRSLIFMNKICKIATQYGQVTFGGDGADELFFGYRRHRHFIMEDKIKHIMPHIVKTALRVLAKLYPDDSALPFFLRIKTKLLSLLEPNYLSYFRAMTVDKPEIICQVISSYFDNSTNDYYPAQEFKKYFSDKKSCVLTNIQKADINIWLANKMLVKSDQASANNGLELRSPFLDKKLFALATRQGVQKLNSKNAKQSINNYLANFLPSKYLNRKKQGFDISNDNIALASLLNDYFDNIYQYTDELFNGSALKKMFSQHKKGLINISGLLWNIMIWDNFYRHQVQSVKINIFLTDTS